MAKRFFRRFTTGSEAIRNHRWLNWIAPGLKHPSLWHLNRRSVSRAMAIGLFWALIPMPWQMIPAAISAIIARANVGISAAMVWVSNPLTWGPIWYGCYRLGRWLLRQDAVATEEAGWRWLMHHMNAIWQPLFLGSIVSGLLLAAFAYLAVDLLWRVSLSARCSERRRRRLAMAGPGLK